MNAHPLSRIYIEGLLRTSFYNEEIKRELKRILIYECRCNERQTRLRGEKFESEKGECVS
jgi:hypothetical protein